MTFVAENTENESRMLEEGMKKPPWRPLHLMGVSTCLIGTHMFTHFPHNLQKYTAAYWIPYYLGLMLIAVPCLYVQLRLGATSQSNVVSLISKHCPLLKGVGFTNVLRLIILSIYHNVLVAYSLYYAFASLPQPYSWSTCDEEWATEFCQNQTFVLNSSLSENEYFTNKVLDLSSGISDEGTVPWHLVLSLFVSWMWVFTLLFPGMYYMARTVTFLGVSALIMCVALLAYGREELHHGKPETDVYDMKVETLVEPFKEAFLDVWLKGLFDDILLSHVWEGILPTMGKYAGPAKLLSHTSWTFVMSILVVVPHLCLNMLMPYVGALSVHSNVDIDNVLLEDVHLPYVVLPAAFHFLNIKRGVTFVFFFILFIFSSLTQVLYVSVAIDNIVDALRTQTLRCCNRKWVLFTVISAIYCVLGFCLGVPHITQAGFYLLVLVRHWMNKLICFLIFFSFIAFTVCYGKQHRYPVANRTVILTWFITASLCSTAITTYRVGFQDEPKEFTARISIDGDYVYPQWAYILGWFIAGGPLVIGLILGFAHAVHTAKGDTCHKKLFTACFPNYRNRTLDGDRQETESHTDSRCPDSALRY